VGVQIYVNTWEGDAIDLRVNAFDTVETVKTMMQCSAGFPCHVSSLSVACQQLEDMCTLSHYNIRLCLCVPVRLLLASRPAAAAPERPKQDWDPPLAVSAYTTFYESFDSRAAAYSKMGVRMRVKGCKATLVRSTSTCAFLHCKHWNAASHACGWKAMARFNAQSDKWEVMTNGAPHNEAASNRAGKVGVDTMAQRTAIMEKLRASPIVRPRMALFALRSDKGVVDDGVDLKTVQNLEKNQLGLQAAHKQDIGQLATATRLHVACPGTSRADQHKAYFAVHHLSKDAKGKPKITLVCTTKSLQRRWVQPSDSDCCAADGGCKYSLLGRPLTVFGVISPAGHLGVCGLMLTSTMGVHHIKEAFQGFRDSTESVTQRSAKKTFCMSDAEACFQTGLSAVFEGKALMCGFHWVQAIRKYWFTHATLSEENTDTIWVEHVWPDILFLQRSMSDAEVASRWAVIRRQWGALGIVANTRHEHENGQLDDICMYMEKQWFGRLGGWRKGYSRTPLPSTNNAREKQVGLTRQDFGQVPGSDLRLCQFMLDKGAFVRVSSRGGGYCLGDAAATATYVCWERTDPKSIDSRPRMLPRDGIRIHQIALKMASGAAITDEEAALHRKARIFSSTQCTCPAFWPTTQCLHTLSLQPIPVEADPTPLTLSARPAGGRTRKAKGCMAGPEDFMEPSQEGKVARARAALRAAAAAAARPSSRAPPRKRPAAVDAGDGPPLKRPAADDATGGAPARRRCTGKSAPGVPGDPHEAHIYVYQPVVGPGGKVEEANLVIHLQVPVHTSISTVYHQIARAAGQEVSAIRVIDLDLGLDWCDDESPVGGKRRVLLRSRQRGG
ncbi:unnamed protein product, partial [Prorocentrum cordatum]